MISHVVLMTRICWTLCVSENFMEWYLRSEIASWTLPSKNSQPNHLLIRNCLVTIVRVKNSKNIKKHPFRNRNYFSLVVNVLGHVLIKKSVAVWQRRTEIRTTVWLSRTYISPAQDHRWVPLFWRQTECHESYFKCNTEF